MAASIYQLELRLSDAQSMRVDLPLAGGELGSGAECSICVPNEQIPARWLRVRFDGGDIELTPIDPQAGAPVRVTIGHWCVLPIAHVRVVPTTRTTYQTIVLDRRLDELLSKRPDQDWAEPYLEVVDEDGSTPRRFALAVGQTVAIGRTKAKCDIVLPDVGDQVSRHHASLEWQKGVPVLRDYSTNGTFWQRPSQGSSYRGVGSPRMLADGDLLSIGPWTLRFRWPDQAVRRQLDSVSPASRPLRAVAVRPLRRRPFNWLFVCAALLAVLCVCGIVWLLSVRK